MTFLLLSFLPLLMSAGNRNKTDPISPVANIATTDEMARPARPDELKSIEQVTVTTSETPGLLKDFRPIVSYQDEHSRKHHNGYIEENNGRHHGGTFIVVGGGVLFVVLLIILI